MMIEHALKLAEFELAEIGLTGWKVKKSQAMTAFGVCDSYRRVIEISEPIAAVNTEAMTRLVVRHEIAHAIVGAEEQHGQQWRACARRLGVPPTATVPFHTPTRRWLMLCSECRRPIGYYYRRVPSPGMHGPCGAVFGDIEWIEVGTR